MLVSPGAALGAFPGTVRAVPPNSTVMIRRMVQESYEVKKVAVSARCAGSGARPKWPGPVDTSRRTVRWDGGSGAHLGMSRRAPSNRLSSDGRSPSTEQSPRSHGHHVRAQQPVGSQRGPGPRPNGLSVAQQLVPEHGGEIRPRIDGEWSTLIAFSHSSMTC